MTPVDSSDAAAKYWEGNITRAESQAVFDEFAATLVKMQEQLLKHEFLTGFMMAKLGVQPAEVQAWMNAKAEEFRAQQASAAQAPPVPPVDITAN